VTPGARPRVCFFVGPSISPTDFRAACSAIEGEVSILPPIEQGDLLRLLTDLPDVIGIVDGYFFQVPSVLHKEILLVLERGARVLGAASLGALRAAELDVFGMEGVGAVYRLYRRGTIDGDDEVATLHTEQGEGFRQLSEPLVNVRHNLRRAQARGIISGRSAAALVAGAKRLYFAERTYDAILDGADPGVVPPDERAALQRFVREHAVDLKRDDALALVRTVAERLNGAAPWPPVVPLKASLTRYFGEYLREYVGRTVSGQHVPDRLVLAFQKLLCPGFKRLYQRAARRCVALDEARHRGLAGAEPEMLIARFRQARGLRSDEALDAWLRARCLSHDELALGLGERDIERRVLALYRAQYPGLRGRAAVYRRLLADVSTRLGMPETAITRPLMQGLTLPWDGPLLREMKLHGAFGPALEVASQILRFSAEYAERHPRFPLARLKRSRLVAWCAVRWGVPEDALDDAVLDRGFASDAEFDEVARHAYAWERFGPGAYHR
jgi:hypothetical protein